VKKLVTGFLTISAKKEGGILLRHLGKFAVAAKVSLGTASRTEPGSDCPYSCTPRGQRCDMKFDTAATLE
jgi:hypothetical protein